MVDYKKYTLTNGLTVILHRAPLSTLVAVNVVYKVGSRDESPDKTGLAHLFEHLMFEGCQYENGLHFDEILQQAGGENNAFTNSDMTSYYDIVSPQNLEVALYLEAGRMSDLELKDHDIETQRSVVIEEYKETCLDVPYGDAWHHILDLSYANHAYRWPVIGYNIQQIKSMSREDFRTFYRAHYHPNNAVLSIAGDIQYDETIVLIDKYFGHKKRNENPTPQMSTEIPAASGQVVTFHKKVPVDSLWLTFNMCHRLHKSYYTIDLISDMLGTGKSSRLYKSLVKQQQIALSVDAYLSGTMGPGLFVIEAKPVPRVTLEHLEQAIWAELDLLKINLCQSAEKSKLVARIETGIQFSEVDTLNKAMNLAYFETLGDIDQINKEINHYTSITPDHIRIESKRLFHRSNSNTIKYISEIH